MDVAATLDTGDLDTEVTTSGTPWAATLEWRTVGIDGNAKQLKIRFDTGLPLVEVRDNESNPFGSGWSAEPGVVGVLVHADIGYPVTIGEIEAAINGISTLVRVTIADPSPANEIDIGTLDTALCTGTFSGGSSDGRYARMLAGLLPPGRVWRLVDSVLSKLLAASADELGRVDARAADLLDEAIPSTAVELLPEYERELGIDAADTIEERQARIVARRIARQRYRPADFVAALEPLLGTVMVIETSHAQAVAMGDVREIFRFFIYRNPTDPGTYYLDAAQELVDAMKPSHTAGHVIESDDFLCDDPYSLCDRDILGA